MGIVTADGKQLWLSGRFDNVVYLFDTTTGKVVGIREGIEPHGLTGLAPARPVLPGAHRRYALSQTDVSFSL
jgi:hypothetical protein